MIVLIAIVLPSFAIANFPRPLGVPIERASFYNPSRDFACFDGSDTIPFHQVNDDYCDCTDGSDEPGTSACSNGYFQCLNAGHKPKLISSMWVNDGICDCCDGSDEHLNSKSECANNCEQKGLLARQEAARKLELIQQGHKIYNQYLVDGIKLRAEKQIRLNELQEEKEALLQKRDELQQLKEEAEIPENEAKDKHKAEWEMQNEERKREQEQHVIKAAFEDIDLDKNGIITLQEFQTRKEFDIDSNGDVSEEEAREYADDNNEIELHYFNEKVWPNIKDIYKKQDDAILVPATTDVTTAAPVTESPTEIHTTDSMDDTEDDGGDTMNDDFNEEISDPDSFSKEEYVRRLMEERGDTDETPRDPSQSSTDADDVMPEYNEETKSLISIADEARKAYDVAHQNVQENEKEHNDLLSFLQIDFGPKSEFQTLRGECYDLTDSLYTYKLCPFSQVTQHGTSLGNWDSWIGPNNNKYSVMHYTKGQGCWNGPDRSAKVYIFCGLENKLLSASEPNRCEYELKFETPAACSYEPKLEDLLHDEL